MPKPVKIRQTSKTPGLGIGLFGLYLLGTSLPAYAGNAVVTNESSADMTCTADGYTLATGWGFDWQIQINAGETFQIGPSGTTPDGSLDWVNCSGLQTRQMNVTPSGPDAYLSVTGSQTRVLNVSLYPYLPSNPDGNFDQLIKTIIQGYQSANPDVLLNPVLNGDINIYSYTDLPILLGAGGFDVMELDTLYMSFLAQNNLVVANTITAADFWPAGVANVTYNGATYGVPSWLCSEFLFAFDPTIKGLNSLGDMTAYMSGLTSNRAKLAGVFLGGWGLTADYLFGYAQNNGYANIASALTNPIDPAVIANINTISDECAYSGSNECITQAGYKALPDGQVAKLLATDVTSTYMGFSEQSFYVELFGGDISQLSLIPMLWGTTQTPMLYTDAFVTSSANCSADPCLSDATAFTDFMISDQMRNYIAFSQDLPAGTPPRHLAVATQSFYQQATVTADPIYSQLVNYLLTANAFPNFLMEADQANIHQGTCQALQAINPNYECKLVHGESRNPAFNRSSASARQELTQLIGESRAKRVQVSPAATVEVDEPNAFQRFLRRLGFQD